MTRQNTALIPIISTAAALIALFFILAASSTPSFEPDSVSYQKFAEQILSGHFFDPVSASEVSQSRAVRTPGYPLLLAFAEYCIGGEIGRVLILHILLAFAAITIIPYMLRQHIWAALTPWIVLLTFIHFRSYFPKVLTEWSALVSILFLFAAFITAVSREKFFSWLTFGLLASACILIRPSLSVVLPLVIGGCLLSNHKSRSLAAVVAGLLPVLLWCFINLNTIGTFSLSAFNGYNLLGVGALVGHAQVKADDSEELKAFISYVNERKTPRPGEESVKNFHNSPNAAASAYDANIYLVAVKFPQAGELGPVKMNDLMKTYGMRAIFSNPINYFYFVIDGAAFIIGTEWLLFLAAAIGFLCLKRRATKILGMATLFGLSIHILHTLLVISIQSIGARYYQLTYLPLIWITVLAALALVKEEPAHPDR